MEGRELLSRVKKLLFAKDYEINIYSWNDKWTISKLPNLTILNTDYASGQGEHYVCFLVDKDKTVTYFDSYGITPHSDITTELLSRGYGRPIRFQDRLLQSPYSSHCALYVIAFCSFMFCGSTFQNFLKCFYADPILNDRLIELFVNKMNEL